jgi:processive 1,2-diacylglycerol beta-glucosyltransferase
MKQKKILFLYQAVGHGHKKIAYNIAAALEKDGYNITLKNILEVEKGFLSEKGTDLYLKIVRQVPEIWKFLYVNKVFLLVAWPFRMVAAVFNNKKVKQILDEGDYDLVICTQITASTIMSYLKYIGYYKHKLVTTFSDFHLHRFWVYKNVDLFLANIIEQKQEMISMGYDPAHIAMCGITLQPRLQITKQEARKKLEVHGEKVALVFGGSFGYGFGEDTIDAARESADTVLVICGTNQALYDGLKKIYDGDEHVKLFAYIDNVQELYAASDVVVSKPGGLSTAECLQWNLPIIVSSYLPGHEELNFNYLLERKLIVDGTKNLAQVVKKEFETHAQAESLLTNSHVQEIVGDGEASRTAIAKLFA